MFILEAVWLKHSDRCFCRCVDRECGSRPDFRSCTMASSTESESDTENRGFYLCQAQIFGRSSRGGFAQLMVQLAGICR